MVLAATGGAVVPSTVTVVATGLVLVVDATVAVPAVVSLMVVDATVAVPAGVSLAVPAGAPLVSVPVPVLVKAAATLVAAGAFGAEVGAERVGGGGGETGARFGTCVATGFGLGLGGCSGAGAEPAAEFEAGAGRTAGEGGDSGAVARVATGLAADGEGTTLATGSGVVVLGADAPWTGVHPGGEKGADRSRTHSGSTAWVHPIVGSSTICCSSKYCHFKPASKGFSLGSDAR